MTSQHISSSVNDTAASADVQLLAFAQGAKLGTPLWQFEPVPPIRKKLTIRARVAWGSLAVVVCSFALVSVIPEPRVGGVYQAFVFSIFYVGFGALLILICRGLLTLLLIPLIISDLIFAPKYKTTAPSPGPKDVPYAIAFDAGVAFYHRNEIHFATWDRIKVGYRSFVIGRTEVKATRYSDYKSYSYIVTEAYYSIALNGSQHDLMHLEPILFDGSGDDAGKNTPGAYGGLKRLLIERVSPANLPPQWHSDIS